jgi:1,4-alpha-glucan branching enzyme
MSIQKQYLKTKPLCKVTFSIPKDMAGSAEDVFLVGEFNNWDINAHPMKRGKDGNFNITLNLEKGREYQFRYLLGSNVWENDDCADNYVCTPYGDCDNSVVVI